MKISSTQIDDFFQKGFITLNQVFSTAEVESIKYSFDRIASIAHTNSSTFCNQGTQFVITRNRIDRVVWCAGVEPRLLNYSYDRRLIGPVSQILGSEKIVQLICQAHFKFPRDGLQFPWHQDSEHRKYGTEYWRDVNGKGSYVQTIIAIDPITKDNGPIRFIERSCLDGHLFLEQGRAAEREKFDNMDVVIPELEPGSVILFGPYTVHGSLPNQSNTPRRIFINGFSYPGANSFSYPGCGKGVEIYSRFSPRLPDGQEL